jgi:hypothetical protein
MKRTLLAAALAATAPLASALCTYPLDATPAQISSAGLTPFPYVNFQSVEYTSASTIDTNGNLGVINYQALSDTGFAALVQSATTGLPNGDVTLPAAGIVAFEMAVDRFPAAQSTEASNYLSVGFTSTHDLFATGSGGQDGVAVNVVLVNSGWAPGSFAQPIGGSATGGALAWTSSSPVPLALPLPATYRVGVYLNMNTRQVGYTLNGVDYGYLQNEGGGSFQLPAGVQAISLGLNGILQSTAESPLIGTPVGGTLVTDQSQFTQPFPAGTTDICSAGGSIGLRLPNGKAFPGKAAPRGLQKLQPLLLPVRPLGQALK